MAQNFWHMTRNIMAREKALYEGHAVAAVAAASKTIADEALALIEVDYEVLPHVIDVDEAMKPDAPLLFEDMITRGVEPTPTSPSNIAKRNEFNLGDIEAGFAEADEVVEMSFKTAAVHQAYIEPQGCVARFDADGQAELWSSSQGHFVVRNYTAQLLDMKVGDLRVYPAEIGGGFGGKTVVYVEPVAVAAGAEVRRPVKVVMSREDVFRATGPTSGSSMTVKIGVKRDGTITAAEGLFKFQAGAFPGLAVHEHLHVRLRALRHRERARGRLRRGVEPAEGRGLSGARLADRRLRGRERARHAGAEDRHGSARAAPEERRQGRHADALRRRSSRMTATPRPSRRCSTIRATRCRSARTRAAASPRATGSTAAASSSATVHVNDDGTVVVATGSPDIGGSRASMAIMAAETLGVDYDQVRPIVADTASVGYTHVTGGSRVTFATGMAVVDATKIVIEDMCAPRRQDLGRRSRGRGLGGRPRQAGEQQCRRLQADVDQGDRRQARGDRRADRRRRGRQPGGQSRPASPPSSATSRSIPRPAR